MDTSLSPKLIAAKKEQTYLSNLFNFIYPATQLEHGLLPSHFVFFVRQRSHEAHNCDDDTSIIADARFVIAKSLYNDPSMTDSLYWKRGGWHLKTRQIAEQKCRIVGCRHSWLDGTDASSLRRADQKCTHLSGSGPATDRGCHWVHRLQISWQLLAANVPLFRFEQST